MAHEREREPRGPGRHGASTLGVHGAGSNRAPGAPVVPPVVQSATFYWSTPEDGELLYSRYGNNPNQVQVGAKLAALEGTAAAAVLGSGMAAAAMTLLSLTRAGDHVVASSQLYGATRVLLGEELPRRGVATSFVDPGSGGWEEAMRPETRVIYIEVPTNPTLRVPDPRPIVALAHARGASVACDATFASPVNLRAAELGIDAVIHSATKYLGGHSDIIAGVVAGSDELVRKVVALSRLYGPAVDPHTAWLLDRGLRTIDVRMQRHNANGMAVAEWLERQDQIERVVYPGLASHPDHDIARALMTGFGGMVSFVLRGGGEAADRFLAALRLALPAPSLGGVETLVSQPRYTSHVGLSRKEREAQGIPDGFVRLSVGVENAEDLVADFEQALRAAG
jgi:cystathionine beta-lyase/cystathionine gamma-synthase